MFNGKKPGVNFFGPSETADGIGRAASLNLQCLSDTEFGVEKFVLSRPVALQKTSELVITDALVKSLPYKINYFHFSARWVPHYFAQLSAGALDGFHNIGYWECEVPDIPEQWAKQFRFFDEVWTGSAFCQQAMSRSSNIPILLMPHPIEEFQVTDRMIDGLVSIAECFHFSLLQTYIAMQNVRTSCSLFALSSMLLATAKTSDWL
jgi:hypothetical protein